MPLKHFTFDLKSNEEKEDRHQPVIDPQKQRLGDMQRTKADLYRGMQELCVDI